MYVQNLNIAALAVPELIGGTRKKLDSPWIRPRSLFSKIFKWDFVRVDPLNIRAKFEIRSFSR